MGKYECGWINLNKSELDWMVYLESFKSLPGGWNLNTLESDEFSSNIFPL
jgi:hypothetical protein